MARDFSNQEFPDDLDLNTPLDLTADLPAITDDFIEETSRPSLPIILFSAASAIGFGIIAFYIAYRMLEIEIELSAGIATLCACFALGGTGATLSVLTGSRAGLTNIAFSCGLIFISLLFLGLCALTGAAAALFVMILGNPRFTP